ncbi:MAG: winged helix-turn-helix transcriptional regulator [Patescibacteria group bacterium]|nr:winged helix-turn-helix transcriptional regulator [Patescibacteria group bacterium]
MVGVDRERLIEILRKLTKKGYYEILLFVSDKRQAHYSEVLDYVNEHGLARSDATVTGALRVLTAFGLLKRSVSQETPIRTTYEITKKGREFVRHLADLQNL